ncbi:MAG TPA: ABC transporter permease [Vicinamibacterales bacterium]|nr:ABC transporter permease [Vicinamibacterales bacterium]
MLPYLRARFTSRPPLDRELDDELRFVVEELTRRFLDAGMSADGARRQALLEVGGMEQVKERMRDVRPGNRIETSVRDIRYAWRGLWRAPAFASVAILTFGLGIGATTAIFSLVSALLLEDLPFRDAGRLVFVWQDLTASGYPRAPLAGPEIQDLRDRATLFEGFGGIWSNTAVLTGDDPEQLRIGLVTADFFTVLGSEAALGRVFARQDETPGPPRAILLSWALWQRRYGGDPSIVGRTVQVNGQPTIVIGVMPERFRPMLPPDASVPDDLQAFIPLNATYTQWPRGQQFLRVVARVKSGVLLSDAQQEIAALAARLGREHASYGRAGLTLYAVPLHADSVRELQPALLALFGGAALLLVVACVNVASLLVARALARGRETAVRMALGAGAGRLFRQYAIEGLVLGTLGGVAGIAIGHGLLALLVALRPPALSRIELASLDSPVLVFAAVASLGWGFLLSLAPLAEVCRTDIVRMLQSGQRYTAVGLPYRRRATLVVLQLALSVVLLVSAALLVRTFWRLQHVDPGFTSGNVITFRLALSGARFWSPDAMNAFSEEFRFRLAQLPGVTGVGAISHLPYDELPNWGTPYFLEDDKLKERGGHADTRAVTAGFFEAVGARLLDGRFFTEADDSKSTPVAVVDRRLAERLWPGESPLGKRFIGDPRTTGTPSTVVTVVGVVGHLRHRRPTEDVREQIYFPVRQAPRNPMAYVVRSAADPAALTSGIRESLRSLDATLPLYDVRPLASYVVSARAARRFTTILAAAFAVTALLLACLGVYGVTAYAVALRRREFGIRIALGARRRQVAGVVLKEGLGLAAWGLVLGLGGAAVAATFLRSQLFGVTATDAVSYAAAAPALLLAAALAAWLPARRAAAASPVESLRTE